MINLKLIKKSKIIISNYKNIKNINNNQIVIDDYVINGIDLKINSLCLERIEIYGQIQSIEIV